MSKEGGSKDELSKIVEEGYVQSSVALTATIHNSSRVEPIFKTPNIPIHMDRGKNVEVIKPT
jgi:hypothetical protein